MTQQNIMRSPTLNNSSTNYLKIKSEKYRPSPSKEGKLRFDLAEGLWEKGSIATLPDRTSSSLKKALSKYLDVSVTNISTFSGADEIIELIPRLYVGSEDNVMVITPTFERLLTTNLKVGAKVISFPLSSAYNFSLTKHTLNSFLETVKKVSPKVIWLSNPNNPTGRVISKKDIEIIAKKFPSILIVIDEAYQEYFSFDNADSLTSSINKFPNILVIRTFSKALGLASVRVGYLVASQEVISIVEKTRTMYNLSTFAQKKAAQTLTGPSLRRIRGKITKIISEREAIEKNLESLNNFVFVNGSNTNFIFLRHLTKDLFDELYKREVVVGDWRSADGIEGQGFVRISINKPVFNRKLISILRSIN